ncbi:ArsC family reductase [Aestuariispira ectoiniformans]|uniref:ArsC family reductase n=1 Tax=Aestuariispira ectoiniformans TaxID=2775080 RepID=UPI00223B6086|nr:ArsC family reductase [Aestuariispira ectoiniformans]
MAVKVYGLKNCDTCRKARKWLDADGVEHSFHDVRADGLAADELDAWVNALGWEALLNRRGTTWRGLPEEVKEGVNEAKATALMLEHPALIKRPVFDLGGDYVLGFTAKQQDELKSKL